MTTFLSVYVVTDYTDGGRTHGPAEIWLREENDLVKEGPYGSIRYTAPIAVAELAESLKLDVADFVIWWASVNDEDEDFFAGLDPVLSEAA